jgi:hypothetical protein
VSLKYAEPSASTTGTSEAVCAKTHDESANRSVYDPSDWRCTVPPPAKRAAAQLKLASHVAVPLEPCHAQDGGPRYTDGRQSVLGACDKWAVHSERDSGTQTCASVPVGTGVGASWVVSHARTVLIVAVPQAYEGSAKVCTQKERQKRGLDASAAQY